MKLAVVSHKLCWTSRTSPSGYVTDGGFPFQMGALSELFDSTTLVVPCSLTESVDGAIPLTGHNLSVVPLSSPTGSGLRRKIGMLFWLARNGPIVLRETLKADGIHAPIPGDVGTIGMLLAWMLRKPLYVRHCGNWFVQTTVAERFWKWFMERFAGGKNLMLATGGASESPSRRNAAIRWIFATTLTERELEACVARREQPSAEHARLIIACRQEKEKGTGALLESLPLIVKEFPNVTLDVVGAGRELEKFKQQAATLGVSERVTFHGKVNHERVLSLLQQASLFCYPTAASEGFPKVVLEALACGLPVVTTRVSVLPQLIKNGCGILLEETTPTAIAQAVRGCLSDEKHYRMMSQKAMETAGRYSLERWRDTIGAWLHEAWQQ